jgi:hypothetical protein
MGRTALYRDPVPPPVRAEVVLEPDVLVLRLSDGRQRRHPLDGTVASAVDGCALARIDARAHRRFVRMLILDGAHERVVVITPPDQGAVAPNVIHMPEAPADAAIVDPRAWDALADWVLGGGRLSACAIADLARIATIASSQFASLIGEVAAQRALELVWSARGPLRGEADLETALQPLTDAARHSPRAAEALFSAFAHAAGATRRRRRLG